MIRYNQSDIDKLKKKLEELKAPVKQNDAREMGKRVVAKMLALIRSGTSPIEGRGKFPAYRGGYRKAISRGYFPGKNLTPVNLTLDGAFLESLTSGTVKRESGFGASIGFNDRLSQDKERGHREGANGQARRPVIPQPGRGESFVSSIKAIYIGILKDIIKRASRK